MNHHRIASAVVAVLALAGTLGAQEASHAVLSVGLASPHGDARDLTHQAFRGFDITVGLEFTPEKVGMTLHPYLGMVRLPGRSYGTPYRAEPMDGTTEGYTYDFRESHPRSFNLTGFHGGLDLVYKPFASVPLRVFTGPAIHTWSVDEVDGNPAWNARQPDTNLKMGWRVGLRYTLTKDWDLAATFTQSEWRSRADETVQARYPGRIELDPSGEWRPTWTQGLNPSRPAYWSFQGLYRF